MNAMIAPAGTAPVGNLVPSRDLFPVGVKPLYLSHSAVACYQRCPPEYRFKYIDRLESEQTSMNLGYGIAVDKGASAFMAGHAVGVVVDPIPIFEASYEKFCETNLVEYPTQWDGKDAAMASGRLLLERFVEKWIELGWTAALDPDGQPMVQLRMKASMPGNIIYTAVIDVVVLTPDGRILVVDLKTPATASTVDFAMISDQLTGYQLMIETHKEALGIDHVDGLAFFDLVKKPIPKTARGAGPMPMDPQIVQPRSKRWLEEFVQSIVWTAEDIRRERFPVQSLDSYNSPYNISKEYLNLLLTGDTTGLKIREKRKYKPDPKQTAMEGV